MKKLVALLLVMLMIVPTMVAGAETSDGKVLNIYCWNDEFQTRFQTFFADKGLVPDGVTVNFVITPNQDNAYQNALDEALLSQESAEADKKVDMFLVEADYALKYVDTDMALDVINTVGLTDADTANMYQYTKDIMTDSQGKLKGVSWQACPGGFIYRRSYAKDVLGTDDPEEVQALLSDWTKFDEVAAKAKEKGYFMLSGFDDSMRVFTDNMTAPWVVDGKIRIDESVQKWIEQTKLYTDNGYNNKANLWSPESGAGAQKDGKVFGYFGPGWFIDFCLAGWTLDDANKPQEVGNGSFGDWAVCKGPQGFSWGGTWICAAAGTDNLDLVKSIMYTLTCDKDTLVGIAQTYNDFTNNAPAMDEIASSDYQSAFLGGQNHIKMFLDSAKSIDRSNMSMYDQTCSEKIQKSFEDYFNGTVDYDTALNNFYTVMEETHPELTH